ncbi:MAG: F0F1 ATP synthase subunit B [bacterium]
MNRRERHILIGGLLLASLWAPAAWGGGFAWAAEAEVFHKSFSFKEEIFKLVNILIVVAILIKVAAKPLKNFMAGRREGIRKSIAEAEKAREEAERLLEEQRAKVADLEAELNRVRKTGEEERVRLRERLQADQETQAERLLEQTRGAIELEGRRARAELQNEASRLALEIAEDILRKNFGPEDQQRLVDDFLSKVGNSNGGSR